MKLAAPPVLLERDGELARIEKTLDAARAGAGSVLLIEGHAGVGKTELVRVARDRARADGMLVLAAVGTEIERSFAYGVVRQLFEPALARLRPRERETILDGAAVMARPALTVGAVTPGTDDGGDSSLAALHGLYWLCANLAQRTPLLLVVDDGHWADPSSLRFLTYVLRRLDDLPVALLLATRPQPLGVERELIAEIAAHRLTDVIGPQPLTKAAVASLIEAAYAEAADEGFVAACHRATGGNAFLLEQLLRGLVANGIAPHAASASFVHQPGPETMRAIAVRAGAGAPGAVELARSVSIFGGDVDVRDAAALAGLDVATAASAADALAAAGILDWRRPLQFVHPIVQSALYEDLPPGQRARRHAAAARILGARGAPLESVAAQLLAAEPVGDVWVVERLREAARNALARASPEAAVAYLTRALAEPPPKTERARVVAELGRAELQAERIAPLAGESPAAAHLREALELTQEPRERAVLARDLTDALFAQLGSGGFSTAFELLDPEVERVRSSDQALALELESHLIRAAWMDASSCGLIIPRLGRFRQLAGSSPAERLLLSVLALHGVLSGEPAASVDELAERAIPREDVDDVTTPQRPDLTAIALMAVDRTADAAAVLERMISAANARAHARPVAIALCWLAHVANRGGAVLDAESFAREALDLSALHGWPLDLPATRAALAEALIEQGKVDEAAVVVEGWEAGSIISWILFRQARAAVRAARGHAEEALNDLDQCGALLRAWGGAGVALYPWRSTAALILAGRGEFGDARRLASEELELARSFGAPRAVGIALRAAGLTARPAAIELLRESVVVLADSPARLELARSATALGAALRRAGRRVDAREHLRLAVDIAQRSGATALADTAMTELRATGARPRRAELSGLDALTASERRVAEHAARGLTNREIAQALFVTARTVEGHLTHVYQKLGIDSRTSLAEVLVRGGAAGNEEGPRGTGLKK